MIEYRTRVAPTSYSSKSDPRLAQPRAAHRRGKAREGGFDV